MITPPNGEPTSWAVAIYETKTSTDPVFNSMRFDTEEHAKSYEFDLGMRWMGFDHSAVVPTGDPPNYTFEHAEQDGKITLTLKRLEAAQEAS